MATIFTKIINGEIPAYKVAEDEKHLAFLDINPLAEGHVLVIPKLEVDYIFDLDSADHAALWNFARSVARAMEGQFDCERIGVAVVGLEVPHVHIHLVPINGVGDINFKKEKLSLPPEKMAEIAERIQKNYK
jgi:histidine triad (HIT) family protein